MSQPSIDKYQIRPSDSSDMYSYSYQTHWYPVPYQGSRVVLSLLQDPFIGYENENNCGKCGRFADLCKVSGWFSAIEPTHRKNIFNNGNYTNICGTHLQQLLAGKESLAVCHGDELCCFGRFSF